MTQKIMDTQEAQQLRAVALEDNDLTQSARLILTLVIDFHTQQRKGCILHDSTIGEKLGMSERTVQRRRKELLNDGYLKEVDGTNRRELVPTLPEKSDDTYDISDESPDTSVETHDSSVVEHDSDVVPPHDTDDEDLVSNNPEGVEAPAPAGETDAEKAVRIFTEELRGPREFYEEAKKIKRHVQWDPEKLSVWRQVCYDTAIDMKDPSNANLKYLLRDFDEEWERERQDTRSMMDKMPGPPVNAN